MEIVIVIFVIIYAVIIAVYGYHHGKYVERMATLKRAREANALFFGGPQVHMIANWRTSVDLISYVSGVRGLPDEVTYDHLSYNPNTKTFKRVDKAEET